MEISRKNLWRFLAVIAVAILLYLARDVILLVAVAVLISLAISPLIDWFQKKNVSRIYPLLLIYLSFICLVVFILSDIIPAVSSQFQEFVVNFKEIATEFIYAFFPETIAPQLSSGLELGVSKLVENTQAIFEIVFSVFGRIFTFITIAVLTFYLTVRENGVWEFLSFFIPVKYQHRAYLVFEKIKFRLEKWLKAQLLLCLIVGLLTWLGLSILKVDYSATLGGLAGILEIIPFLGPIITAIIAFIIASAQSKWLGLLVIGLFVIIQRIENDLLIPTIFKKTLALNPAVVIVVAILGAKFAGLIGIILAVPTVIIIQEVVKEIETLK